MQLLENKDVHSMYLYLGLVKDPIDIPEEII